MKTEAKPTKTIENYIATFPEDVQPILRKVQKTIRKVLPKAEETISYGIPTFKMNGKYVVYFAGYKNHISMYPLIFPNKALEKDIAIYRSGRGTAQFPLDKPIPYPLITKIAQALLKANIARTKQK